MSKADAARRRLAEHYLTVTHTVIEKQSFAALDQDWQQVQERLKEVANQEIEQALDLFSDLIYALNIYWGARGMLHERVDWCRQGYDLSAAAKRRQAEANHAGNLGKAYLALGQGTQALHFLQTALSISQELENEQSQGEDWGNLGEAYRKLGQIEQALECHQNALTINKTANDRWGQHHRTAWSYSR